MFRRLKRIIFGNNPIEIDSSKNLTPSADGSRLFSRGFGSVLGVSFFGAANDNILKQILILMVAAGGLWENRLGAGSIGIVSLVLSLPFIFLSGYAGQIADKFSKRDVILWVKIAEIPIAIIALVGLYYASFWLSLLALLLLAIQSSFYGPAKFGIIPDVVNNNQLSYANGLINAMTNVAIILGSLIAGPLADMYYPTIAKQQEVFVDGSFEPLDTNNITDSLSNVLVPDPLREPNRLPAGLALLGIGLVGLFAASRLPKIKPTKPDLKFSGNFFGPHIQVFKDSTRPLLVVMFSWSGFYLVGQLALLLLADLKEPLGVTNSAITNLIGLLAISIVIGSCTVAFLSGKSIRPHFSLLGAIGMTICFSVMGLAPLDYTLLAVLVFLIGVSAGFYIVPLQSLLQFLSPEDERGRFFGTANALSFVFISGAGLIYIALSRLGVPPERIPIACAILATMGTIIGFSELRRINNAQESATSQSTDQ